MGEFFGGMGFMLWVVLWAVSRQWHNYYRGVTAMTDERLAKLERAADAYIERGRADWILYLTAGEVADLCAAARHGHESGTWVRIRSSDVQDMIGDERDD